MEPISLHNEFPPGSIEAKDLDHLLHPNTNLGSPSGARSGRACPSQGRVPVGQPWQAVPGGYGGPLVHGDRVWRRGTRQGRAGANQETLVLAVVRGQNQRTERPVGRKAQVDDAIRRGPRLFRPIRFRRERHADQADVVLPQPHRQSRKRRRSSRASAPITASPSPAAA